MHASADASGRRRGGASRVGRRIIARVTLGQTIATRLPARRERRGRHAPVASAAGPIAAARPIDVAEAFRDLPGLALLESARPGRNARWTYLTADPVAVLESPAAGPDPFAVARRLVARLDRDA